MVAAAVPVSLSDRKAVIVAHTEFKQAMSRAFVLHRTGAPASEIRELVDYARVRLITIVEAIRSRRVSRINLKIPTIESMEQRIEAFETLLLISH
jgi:hypothetical protein